MVPLILAVFFIVLQVYTIDVNSQDSVVPRIAWLAQPPNGTLSDLKLPTDRVIIAHTTTELCNSQAECTFRVRFIQTFHMESRNFDDIAYNFLVGGDGNVYEGRGWDKLGAHTKGYNADSICIALIGTFNSIEPSEKQINATKFIINEGVKLQKLTSDYKLYGHRQFVSTDSPGDALFKIIKNWSHFATAINPNN